MCRLSWFLDPGGWSKTAMVGLYFIFPEICTLSLTDSILWKIGGIGVVMEAFYVCLSQLSLQSSIPLLRSSFDLEDNNGDFDLNQVP
ncbi:hypothetical protein STEG23_000456 [Scotinomys teguina]